MFVGLLTCSLVFWVLAVSSVEGSYTLLSSLLQLVHQGVGLIGALDEDDALVDLARLKDLASER